MGKILPLDHFIRVGILLLFINQTAAAALCRSHFTDSHFVLTSAYDVQPLYKDPIGPFQIESHFRAIRKLLGSSIAPQNLIVKIIASDSKRLVNTDPNPDSNLMTLNIGIRFDQPMRPDDKVAVSKLAEKYSQKWIMLNWQEAPRIAAEFLKQAITVTYTADINSISNIHPLTQVYWDHISAQATQNLDLKRELIPALVQILRQNPGIQTPQELKNLLDHELPRVR